MNLIKLATLAILITPTYVNAALNYSSTFTDNGNLVVETRTFSDSSVETWEWLDLTVTNGLSFNSIEADLADNNILDNSVPLTGNSGAISDVTSLSGEAATGWETVSALDVTTMLNNFFTLNLVVGDTRYEFGAEMPLVDYFMTLFGDTYYEGRLDDGSYTPANIGETASYYSWGHTNSQSDNTNNVDFDANIMARVTDGAYHTINEYDGVLYPSQWDEDDSVSLMDSYQTGDTFRDLSADQRAMGTWLVRNATEVSAPSAFSLLMLTIFGLGITRRRKTLTGN